MREDQFPADKPTSSNKAQLLKQAGTIFKQVTQELYHASMSEEDSNSEDSDIHLDFAMQKIEEAQKILNKI